jgi:plasmid stabilization system protein ParE
MAEIRWTEEALRRLQDIRDYIAADNPKAAYEVVSGIYEKAQLLRRFPEIDMSIVPRLRVTSESCSMGITGSPIFCAGRPTSTFWVYSMVRLILTSTYHD